MMPRSPQDIYARNLLSSRGYPLWTPEPSKQLLAYRRDGLRIGDVGIVIPEDGYFDVFFNICLQPDHPFHQPNGVPDNFVPILLNDTDIRTIHDAENSGRVIATSSVKTVRDPERSGHPSPSARSYRFNFNLTSSEGALLVLPEGAESQDLRNYRCFLEAATHHGVDWYRFVKEKVGQIIGDDSLYLITGLHKTRSWSVAAFEKAPGIQGGYPAQLHLSQLGDRRKDIAATCPWDTTRTLDWRVGPADNFDFPNQTVLIRGFKIAHRTIFRRRWISVKANVPSTRPNPVRSTSPPRGDSWIASIFHSLPGGRSAEASSGSMQDEIATDPALSATRNEIESNGALAVGEDVVIHPIPEASQAFHPSDAINQLLLSKAPSANIAVTHDDEWATLLEQNLLRPEDIVQEGLLGRLVPECYHIILDGEAVYLRERPNVPGVTHSPRVNTIAVAPKLGAESLAMTPNTPNALEQGYVTAPQSPCGPSGNYPMWTDSDHIVNSRHSIPPYPLDSRDDVNVLHWLQDKLLEQEAFRMRDHSNKPKPRLYIPQASVAQPDNDSLALRSLSPPVHIPGVVQSYDKDRAAAIVPSRRSSDPPVRSSSPKAVRDTVEIHSLLSPRKSGEYRHWDMLKPARGSDFDVASTRSWKETWDMPATEPPREYLNIICRALPGMISAYAQDPVRGVTCGEVLSTITAFLNGDMNWEEYERFASDRPETVPRPTGPTIKRRRVLGVHKYFGGLVVNDAFMKERCGRASSGVFELQCVKEPAWRSRTQLLAEAGASE